MTPLEPIDLRLLAKYLDGTASPEERERVVRWVGADSERRAAVAELAAAWVADARVLERGYDADTAWSRLASEFHFPPRRSEPARRIVRTWHSPANTGWAAGLLLAAGVGAWLVFARGSNRAIQSAPTERVYQTARAQRAVVRLADGSEVTLNADSRLRIPGEFGGRKRELYLDGEAFFSVVPDSTAPFVVLTSVGITRDIGTKFSVRAYPDDGTKQLDVVVAEGAVAITAVGGRDSLVLRASEAGRVTRDGQLRAEHGVDVRSRLGWIEGRLEFRNVPLRDVLPILARWYDAELRVGDAELGGYPITADFTGERVGEAVDAIARVIGARVVRRGNVLLLIRNTARD